MSTLHVTPSCCALLMRGPVVCFARGVIDASKTLISKRADLYRSKNELRAANSRLVKGLQVMEKRLNPRNTKVSV